MYSLFVQEDFFTSTLKVFVFVLYFVTFLINVNYYVSCTKIWMPGNLVDRVKLFTVTSYL